MIFITVGTHEQGLDRLLIEIDNLVKKKIIDNDIFAQIGYSNYDPIHYSYERMISYDKMESFMNKADIIITHGGPGSIFQSLQHGKIPIVVPRNPIFNEHVDNHQILFAERLEKQNKILAVYDIHSLKEIILNYDQIKFNNFYSKDTKCEFINKFSKLVDELL